MLCHCICTICKLRNNSIPVIICFTRLLFRSIYIDTHCRLYFLSHFIWDILRHTNEIIPMFNVSLCVVIVYKSINESFVTHSLCIQFWLPKTSCRQLSWNRFNRSTVVGPFKFCLLNYFLFYLFLDNDNRINRIFGPCLCTLQYIR